MRTQLIESVVVGTTIGSIVLLARWLVPNQVLIQLVILLVGAGLLLVIQRFLMRNALKQQPNPPAPAAYDAPAPEPAIPASTPQTVLASPRFGWADEPEPNLSSAHEPASPESTGDPKADDNAEKVV